MWSISGPGRSRTADTHTHTQTLLRGSNRLVVFLAHPKPLTDFIACKRAEPNQKQNTMFGKICFTHTINTLWATEFTMECHIHFQYTINY